MAVTAPVSTARQGDTPPPLATQVGLLAGPFLTMLDSNIVNVALPDIARQFQVSIASVQWVVSAYLLALAASLAGTAYLAKRFGTDRIYLASLLGFTLASTLCALSPNLSVLIAARAAQGVVGAPLVPLAMSMLLGKGGAVRQMPATAGILLFLAPALGPTVGGLLIHLAGWPLIFLVNLPIGLLAALSFWRTPRPYREPGNPAARLDPVGLMVLAGGLTGTIYGSTQGPTHGWLSIAAWPFWLGGGVLLLVYVAWAWRHPHLAVSLTLLQHPQTALAIGLSALASIVMFAVLILLPIFMEDLQGLSPLTAGLVLFPQGVVTGLGTALGNQLAPRYGVRRSVVAGMAILTVSTASLLLVTLATPAWLTALLLCGRGLAIGLAIQPLITTMLGGLSPADAADANTVFNVAQRTGASIGIALLATFFQLREQLRIGQVLHQFGIAATRVKLGAASGRSGLPPMVRDRLAQAAVAGFHDTVLLLVALSGLGVLGALVLRPASFQSDASDDGV